MNDQCHAVSPFHRIVSNTPFSSQSGTRISGRAGKECLRHVVLFRFTPQPSPMTCLAHFHRSLPTPVTSPSNRQTHDSELRLSRLGYSKARQLVLVVSYQVYAERRARYAPEYVVLPVT